MSEMKEAKSQLRKHMQLLLRAQQTSDKRRKSELIINKVLRLDELQRCKVVMTYVSDEYEVETSSLIKQLLRDGKRIVIPFVNRFKDIVPYEIFDLDGDTVVGPLGIREPNEERRLSAFDVSQVELVIVPGVAFDNHGRRLGRGWGCYDRFLRTVTPQIPTIGLAFDFQLVSSIPVTNQDKVLTRVISN